MLDPVNVTALKDGRETLVMSVSINTCSPCLYNNRTTLKRPDTIIFYDEYDNTLLI